MQKTDKGEKMKGLLKGLSKVLTSLITPEMKKQAFLYLGDYLVKSTKNKLDDKIWNACKSKLIK